MCSNHLQQLTVRDIWELLFGTANFRQNNMKEKVNQWTQELRILSKIAWYKPQAAYSCFITGFKHKPTYFMCTIPNIGKELKQLDDVLRTEFMRAITWGLTVVI